MSEKNPDQSTAFEDEINFMEFLQSTKIYLRLLLKNRISLLIFLLIGLVGVYINSLRQELIYPAELSFMLSDDGSNQGSGFNNILSQFGIPVSSGKYNIDKLLEISRSRSIVQDVLFEKAEIDGNTDFLSNHMIRLYDLTSKWSKSDTSYANFSFAHSRLRDFKEEENYALKKLYRMFVGGQGGDDKGLLEADYGRDHYIMYFKVRSTSEKLSIALTKILFEKVKDYYVNKSTEKQLSTFRILRLKRDSIQAKLTSVDYELATIKDKTLDDFNSRSSLRQSELNTQSLLLKTALAKSEENLILAEFALKNSTPLVQLIDSPIPPIKGTKTSIARLCLYGVLLGLSLFCLFHLSKFLMQ